MDYWIDTNYRANILVSIIGAFIFCLGFWCLFSMPFDISIQIGQSFQSIFLSIIGFLTLIIGGIFIIVFGLGKDYSKKVKIIKERK